MLKPDPSVIEAAIAADAVIARLQQDILAGDEKEKARIAQNEEELKAIWKERDKLILERGLVNNKIAGKDYAIAHRLRLRRFNKKHHRSIGAKIEQRKRYLIRREERKYLESQRVDFRKSIGV